MPFRTFPIRPRQRGAAAVSAAILMVALIALLALGVDVGRLYYGQRDLQRLANIAALDAVRVVSGCAADGVPGTQAEAAAEVQASVNRNQPDGSGGGVTAFTELGRQLPGTAGAIRQFELLPGGDFRQDSVRVRLTGSNPARIFPLLTGDRDDTLTAVAVAQQPATAAFTVGTEVVALSNGLVNNLLAGLLCQVGDLACQSGVIALNVASSTTGLANVQITAEQLATAVGLSVEDLSNPTNLDGTVVLGGGSGVFSQLGGTLGGSVAGLVGQLGSLASNNSPIPLRDLLDPALGALSPDTPVINLFDLLMALGQAANADSSGARSVELPNVEVAVPSIAGLPGVQLHTFLRIIEAPRIGTGKVSEAVANNAQVRLEVRASVDLGAAGGLLKVTVEGLGGSLSTPLNIGIDVTAAQAIATLESLQCPSADVNGGMPVVVVGVENSLANVDIGTFSGAPSAGSGLSETGAVPLLGLPAIPILLPSGLNLQLGLNADIGSSQGDSTPEFRDFEKRTTSNGATEYRACGAGGSGCAARSEYSNPQTVGTGVSIEALEVSLIGGLSAGSCPPLNLLCIFTQGSLGTVVDSINDLLNEVLAPLVNDLADLVINPLLGALGVGLGSAELTLQAVSVAQPRIISQEFPAAPTGD